MKKKPEAIALKLGRRIRLLRKQRGWTQEELADRAKVGFKYLQDLEGTQPHNASVVTLQKLARAFDIEPQELLKFSEE